MCSIPFRIVYRLVFQRFQNQSGACDFRSPERFSGSDSIIKTTQRNIALAGCADRQYEQCECQGFEILAPFRTFVLIHQWQDNQSRNGRFITNVGKTLLDRLLRFSQHFGFFQAHHPIDSGNPPPFGSKSPEFKGRGVTRSGPDFLAILDYFCTDLRSKIAKFSRAYGAILASIEC